MKNIILFDSDIRNHLLPLTFTRPVAELRCGILTIREKWEMWLEGSASYITQGYLAEKYPINISDDNYIIDGSILPNTELCLLIQDLEYNHAILQNGELVAARLDDANFERLADMDAKEFNGTETHIQLTRINRVWDLFLQNKAELISDFQKLTNNRKSQPISNTNQIIGSSSQIFIEEGGKIEASILNTTEAPIYVGKGAEIMEGCMIRGGLALCEGAQLKMGAKIYGATTLGNNCKGGGEIGNSILLANSNKGHDGYLGNSIIGEWCNLGADTNTSNLKNTYEAVKLWNYVEQRFLPTGQQFLGLIMGDHAKAGINTMFNTGTVVGVAANVFGAGYPRNFIPSFAWGGADGFITHRFEQACKTAEIVCARRKINFSNMEKFILQHIFEATKDERVWDKNKTP
jgi:UDP-N-acetylglucosamine diphosphorylase/glucosamine-1-phosphate N-acetyltransferase